MRGSGRTAGVAVVACAIVLTACQGQPSPPPAQVCPDFTRPGTATAMVDQIVADAGSADVIMVEVQPRELNVSVLVGDSPITWACRDGVVGEVATDITYVDQATFDPQTFDLGDVGALFRAAAAIAGTSTGQQLQIVDYSGGQVMMSVATVPESRTVFFHPDGSLLENLDFATLGGITRGLREVAGQLSAVTQVSVGSEQSVWVEHVGGAPGTVTRRLRTATVPVTTITRATARVPTTFAPTLVRPEVIWSVAERHVGSTPPAGTSWSVVIEDRDGLGAPRMFFSFGTRQVVTELNGRPV